MTAGRSTVVLAAIGAAAVLVVVSVVALLALVGNDGPHLADRVTVAAGGGTVLRLQPDDGSSARARADDLCLPSSPAVAGATVLDCQLAPLIDPASSRCNEPGSPAEAGRLCRPLDPVFGSQVLGWVVTGRGGGRRTLAVWTGARSPAADAPPGTPSSPTLERKYVAVDDAGRWSELAVCPTDLDGNGSTDLVVLTRSTEPARTDRPELVVLSIGTAAAGEKAMPTLQSMTLDADVGRSLGEGCASPVVRALRYDRGRGLELDPAVLGTRSTAN